MKVLILAGLLRRGIRGLTFKGRTIGGHSMKERRNLLAKGMSRHSEGISTNFKIHFLTLDIPPFPDI
jgi:hypothetical protein